MIFFVLSLAVLFLLTPATALADIVVNCNGLPGCGLPAENVIFSSTIPGIAQLLITIVGAGSVLFVMVGGMQMILQFGDEARVTKARTTIYYAFGGLGLSLASASIVHFVGTERYLFSTENPDLIQVGFQEAAGIVLVLFNVSAVGTIMYAGIRMLLTFGKSDEFTKSTGIIRWTIIGAVIVNIARIAVQAFLNIGI